MSSESHTVVTDWFRKWRVPLRKFLVARWSVRPADLDDVAQEVFLRLLRYERTEPVHHPQAYLYKMAANVAAEWSMRARNRCPHDQKWLGDLRADTEPEEVVVRAAARHSLQVALESLAPRPREVLRLHYGEGLSHAEIAERLGVSARMVKRDLVNAYGKLRERLDESVIDGLRFEAVR